MRLILIAFVFLTPYFTFSQDTLLLNTNGELVSERSSAAYFSLAGELELDNFKGDGVFFLTKYHMTGERFTSGYYLVENDQVKHGKFSFYYRNGDLKENGTFVKGLKHGEWKSYYPGGNLKDIVVYEESDNGKGMPEMSVVEYYDSLGEQLVKDGNGLYQEFSDSLALISEGYVKNGYKVGEWKGWYPDGTLYYTESYKNGELVQGQSQDREGNLYNYKALRESTAPIGGYRAFYSYIAKRLRYPANARRLGIQGKVYIQFVVNKQGDITKVVCVKGIGGGCDEEAVRVVKSAFEWPPPLERGQRVEQRAVLPITFKLG